MVVALGARLRRQVNRFADRFLIFLDLKNADELIFLEARSRHCPSSFVGRTLIQTGGSPQWQVSPSEGLAT